MKMLMIVIAFVVLACNSLLSQDDDLPDSYLNLGVGLGVPYGGFGVKSVVGPKNSGMLLSVGLIPGTDKAGYVVGFQLSSGAVFFELGYGIVAVYKIDDEKPETLDAGIAVVGGMIPLGEPKRIFIDIGMGMSSGKKEEIGPLIINRNGFIFNVGMGFRIGDKSLSDTAASLAGHFENKTHKKRQTPSSA